MNMKTVMTAAVMAAALTTDAQTAYKNDTDMDRLELTKEWDKTFPKSEKVSHEKVTFRNRYGITLAADLYKPVGADGKLPALAVCGPFGAVKEQASGLYAQELAERGFLTIAFDPSFTGESGGSPRYVASPDINTEDFCAAVDWFSVRDDVDASRIGILGILRNLFSLAAAVAQNIVRLVDRDPVDPARHARAAAERIELPPGGQHRLLNRLIRIGAVSDNAVRNRAQHRQIPVYAFVKAAFPIHSPSISAGCGLRHCFRFSLPVRRSPA